MNTSMDLIRERDRRGCWIWSPGLLLDNLDRIVKNSPLYDFILRSIIRTKEQQSELLKELRYIGRRRERGLGQIFGFDHS